jgi:hypothetical protein
MRRALVLLAFGALLTTVGLAGAQSETPTPQPAAQGVTVTVAGWDYDLDPNEPLTLFADRVTTGNDSAVVQALIFWRNADGSVTRLTACDDVAIACAPLYTRGTAALAGAHQGDAFALGDEVINDGNG